MMILEKVLLVLKQISFDKCTLLGVLVFGFFQSLQGVFSPTSFNTFLDTMYIFDGAYRADFTTYCSHFVKKISKKRPQQRKRVLAKMHDQARCDMHIHHPELIVIVDQVHELEDEYNFLTWYALLHEYQRSYCNRINGSLFRLGSYLKDTARTWKGWFKSIG